ncbi:MAG: winged helix-turn-helix transcriptional regulator [Muribaculaceae bacterium]|nr:winged helix-turn-helix transcriptional regulator [Muribaculaceae bacterium]
MNCNVGGNDDLNDNERKILNLITENKQLTIRRVSEILSLSQRQVERLFASLKVKGKIMRRGSAKCGEWVIKD